jgi:DNA mismatch repair protein MutL
MARIRQLPSSVVSKIAAGEVIERPASVVKELLENSIDAGATRIDVEAEQGGCDLIRVVDNGCGIQTEDMPLAFASHATSKLTDAEDLFRIGTLGFRGEALSSIGGVAQVTLQSRPPEQPSGNEISCHGGVLSPVRAWNGMPGTRIEVKHLFFNTPVRRKFLRSPATEMGHLAETFTRLALARPGLQLTLRHNAKNVYEIPASADLLERIGRFFGNEIRSKLYPIEAKHEDVRLFGFVADPAIERGNAKLQYLFLNGRWIRDRSLSHALQEAYRGLLMTGRYAVAFLFLEMPPDRVDVNVHPTKAEVRFREGQFLYSMILSTIRSRLSAENLTARLQVPSTLPRPMIQNVVTGGTVAAASAPLPPPPIFPEQDAGEGPPSVEELQRAFGTPPASAERSSDMPLSPLGESGAQPLSPLRERGWGEGEAPSTVSVPLPPKNAPIMTGENGLRAIQLYNAYLVIETPEGMLVIDQHALHERILFEQFKRRIREGPLQAQRLLTPEPVELTMEQAALALEHRSELADLGLQVEDFGGGTVLLHSYPAILANRSPERILKSVVDHLSGKERLPTREQVLNDLLSLMACHSAVRAGDPLTQEQIAMLVAQRHLADDAHHCPHGRPTALLFSRNDLDRQFGRT